MQDIEHYSIPIYNFPFDAEEDDDEIVAENSSLRVSMTLRNIVVVLVDLMHLYCSLMSNNETKTKALLPFALVGSEHEIEVGGELVRAREYPWGVVEVDNPAHSDFLRLRTALLSTHLTDLKEITHDVNKCLTSSCSWGKSHLTMTDLTWDDGINHVWIPVLV
jgi:cell division control protein 11